MIQSDGNEIVKLGSKIHALRILVYLNKFYRKKLVGKGDNEKNPQTELAGEDVCVLQSHPPGPRLSKARVRNDLLFTVLWEFVATKRILCEKFV